MTKNEKPLTCLHPVPIFVLVEWAGENFNLRHWRVSFHIFEFRYSMIKHRMPVLDDVLHHRVSALEVVLDRQTSRSSQYSMMLVYYRVEFRVRVEFRTSRISSNSKLDSMKFEPPLSDRQKVHSFRHSTGIEPTDRIGKTLSHSALLRSDAR